MQKFLSKILNFTTNHIFNKKYYSQNAIKLKINSPEFHSILTKELLKLEKIFKENNYQLKIAGGAVRDLLSGICLIKISLMNIILTVKFI